VRYAPPWAAFLVLLGEVCASVGCLSRTTTTVGEARSLRCLTRLLLHGLLHLHDLVDTKLGGSAIITAYSASLQLCSGARIQGWKTKFSSIQLLGDKNSSIIVFRRLLGCTLEDVYEIL
jgi:hypothetical protein